MINSTKVDVNRPITILAIAILASITPAAALLGPMIVGGLVTQLGFSPQEAGYIISAELGGAAMATFPALIWMSRISWRKVLYASIAITMLGNLLSALYPEFWTLIITRFLTGLAVGSIMLITLVTSGMTINQEKTLGFWMLSQVVFTVIGFSLLPYILPASGIQGFYFGMLIVMALLTFWVRFFPEKGNIHHEGSWKDALPETKRLAPVSLLAVGLFYVAMGILWTYVERIADAAGLDAQAIATSLSVAAVVGMLGAAAATMLNTKFGRLLPFLGGVVVLSISIFMLFGLESALVFAISAAVFKYSWMFITPYILANMTSLDPSGKLITATNFVIAGGLSLGPGIGAYLLSLQAVGEPLNYTPLILMGLFLLIVSCFLLLPAIRSNSLREKQILCDVSLESLNT